MSRGVSLYFALLMIAALLSLGLGVSTLSVLQVQTVTGAADSVVAFFAADAGVEKGLYLENTSGTTTDISDICPESSSCDCSGKLANGQCTVVGRKGGDGQCPSGVTVCIESVGSFQGTDRAIRISK